MPADKYHFEELPDWAIVRPEEYLVAPHFRNDGPNWITAVQKIIDEGRATSRKKLPPKVLSERDIEALGTALARYIKAKVDWQGWLNKGDADRLKRVQRAAIELIDAIKALGRDDAGAKLPRPTYWYLKQVLTDSRSGLPIKKVVALLGLLSRFEIRSPLLDEEEAASTTWKSPTREGVRATLQQEIDAWWVSVAELPKDKIRVKSPAYHLFLSEVFGRIRLADQPGTSETAIKAARAGIESREKAQPELYKALGKALSNLKGPNR